MISGTIAISDIDYEKCFLSLFPAVIRKINAIESPGIGIRFINKMGDDLLPVVIKIMDYIDDEEKEMLLLGMIDLFQEPICETLNQFLSSQEMGNAIRIGKIGALKEEGSEKLFLIIKEVKIDYGALVKTNFVDQNIDTYVDNLPMWTGLGGGDLFKGAARIALRAGARVAPGEMERRGIELLNRPDIKEKVMSVIPGGLEKAGLYLTVQDFSLTRDKAGEEHGEILTLDEAKTDFRLTEELEEILLNGIVKYLKGTVEHDDSQGLL